jgi:hypothetical protein
VFVCVFVCVWCVCLFMCVLVGVRHSISGPSCRELLHRLRNHGLHIRTKKFTEITLGAVSPNGQVTLRRTCGTGIKLNIYIGPVYTFDMR